MTDDQHLCLELSNRFFTPDHLASEYATATMNQYVDPIGILSHIGNGPRHTEDNEVLYFERTESTQG